MAIAWLYGFLNVSRPIDTVSADLLVKNHKNVVNVFFSVSREPLRKKLENLARQFSS